MIFSDSIDGTNATGGKQGFMNIVLLGWYITKLFQVSSWRLNVSLASLYEDSSGADAL